MRSGRNLRDLVALCDLLREVIYMDMREIKISKLKQILRANPEVSDQYAVASQIDEALDEFLASQPSDEDIDFQTEGMCLSAGRMIKITRYIIRDELHKMHLRQKRYVDERMGIQNPEPVPCKEL